MTSGTINLSTGPVGLTTAVKKALFADAFSHRSEAFRKLYLRTTGFLCRQFQVEQAYLLTGSGTLANEAMLWQIKLTGRKGLILSNGEFGERLITQADRQGLSFHTLSFSWGQAFDLEEIREHCISTHPGWILFCHCETSTGMINDLDVLARIAEDSGALCFADCMSTVGAFALDLSKISMASCSSGKGLASVPGLAVVLSNIQPRRSVDHPVYTDLYQYRITKGIPFTLSSNLVAALLTSLEEKLCEQQFQLTSILSLRIHELLSREGLVCFPQWTSHVITIRSDTSMIREFEKAGLVIGYESSYLRKRNWAQLACLGTYSGKQVEDTWEKLGRVLEASRLRTPFVMI